MRLVDTATLARYLNVTPREVRRRAQTGQLARAGQRYTGKRGRPSLIFDLDDLRGELDKAAESADIDR